MTQILNRARRSGFMGAPETPEWLGSRAPQDPDRRPSYRRQNALALCPGLSDKMFFALSVRVLAAMMALSLLSITDKIVRPHGWG